MNIVWIFLGGGLGSVARYALGRASASFYPGEFPLGTLLANLVACLLLGLFVYLVPLRYEQSWLHPALVMGFCGGFSTFSTFSGETLNLISNGNWGYAIFNVLVSVFAGVGIIFLVKSTAA